MTTLNESLIRDVVSEVLSRLGTGNGSARAAGGASGGDDGVFQGVNEAVAAAKCGFGQLARASLETRRQVIECIREVLVKNADQWARIELDETQIGRLDHKHEKLFAAARTPGMEMLTTEAVSGDHGLCVTEHAPWGVLGVITPVTHSIPTLA